MDQFWMPILTIGGLLLHADSHYLPPIFLKGIEKVCSWGHYQRNKGIPEADL